MSVVAAGGYMGIAYITSIFGRVLWGAVSDLAFGSRRIIVMTIVGVLCTAALVGMSVLGSGTPSLVLVAMALLLGVTTLSWGGIYNVAIAEMVGPSNSGATLGAG